MLLLAWVNVASPPVTTSSAAESAALWLMLPTALKVMRPAATGVAGVVSCSVMVASSFTSPPWPRLAGMMSLLISRLPSTLPPPVMLTLPASVLVTAPLTSTASPRPLKPEVPLSVMSPRSLLSVPPISTPLALTTSDEFASSASAAFCPAPPTPAMLMLPVRVTTGLLGSVLSTVSVTLMELSSLALSAALRITTPTWSVSLLVLLAAPPLPYSDTSPVLVMEKPSSDRPKLPDEAALTEPRPEMLTSPAVMLPPYRRTPIW